VPPSVISVLGSLCFETLFALADECASTCSLWISAFLHCSFTLRCRRNAVSPRRISSINRCANGSVCAFMFLVMQSGHSIYWISWRSDSVRLTTYLHTCCTSGAFEECHSLLAQCFRCLTNADHRCVAAWIAQSKRIVNAINPSTSIQQFQLFIIVRWRDALSASERTKIRQKPSVKTLSSAC
jgi:hypothetical protein